MDYDLAVVGGGPGGYPGAIRAAQLGLRVVLFEERGLGGECTLYGCVPTKTVLLYVSSLLALERIGAVAEAEPSRLWGEARRVAEKLSGGIGELLARYGVRVVNARARLLPGAAGLEAGGLRYRARSILLAPGSVPSSPPGVEVDNRLVVDNRGWLMRPPYRGERLLIVGGGAVGVEAAVAAAALGARVVLLEALPRILPGLSRQAASLARRILARLGVEVVTGCPLESLERVEGGVRAVHCGGSGVYDRVLVATGRRPATSGIGLEDAGVGVDERGFIRVDEYLETSVAGVYAAGDAAGHPMLAHKAIHQSLVAAANAAAALGVEGVARRRFKPRAMPVVIHLGAVEAASVGVGLDEAKRRGLEVAKVRLGWSLYAETLGVPEGYAAVVYEPGSYRIVGFEAVAPGAGDAAAEAALAIEAGLGLEDLAEAVHPHPERSEQLPEAALAGLGLPLHFYGARRG